MSRALKFQNLVQPRKRLKGPAWVSAEALNVAPELVGAPLATPIKRLLAAGVDAVVIALLSTSSGIWLVAAAALTAWQFRGAGLAKKIGLSGSSNDSGNGGEARAADQPTRSWVRKALVWGLTLACLWLAGQRGAQWWQERADRNNRDDREVASELATSATGAPAVGVTSATSSGPLRASSSPEAGSSEARAALGAHANSNPNPPSIPPLPALSALPASPLPFAGASGAAASAHATGIATARGGATATGNASAWRKAGDAIINELANNDEAQATAASAPKASAMSPQERIEQLEDQLETARQPKVLQWRQTFMEWGDELGLGFGWAIVYFSLLPVWLQGQTLGKKLLSLRVVELTGKPLRPLMCFGRYGGYAAGAATGFVGFAQVLWDPNRQAIQDKIAHTVVIDLRATRREQPKPPDESPLALTEQTL